MAADAAFVVASAFAWAYLAKYYLAAQPFVGRYERVRSSQMGPLGLSGSARNALYFGIDLQGLHLRMFLLFRLNCRDLFLPWSEITVTSGRSFSMAYVEFHFRKASRVSVRIDGNSGELIKALAGPAWPAEAPRDVAQH